MKALITGANGDIGNGILDYLIENHYDIVSMDKDISRQQKKVLFTQNLSIKTIDFNDTEKLRLSLDVNEKPFDVLIYVAGIREIIPAVDLTLEEWNKVQQVNLTSAFLLSQYTAKLAIKHQHPLSIIYISSISGLQGEPERAAYCASKHGLIGLAKSLAMEFAHHKIRVNVIAPGIIETDLTRDYKNDEKISNQIIHNIPLARWGQPYHIVQAVDFMIKNDYVTGSTLTIDGGWTAGKRI